MSSRPQWVDYHCHLDLCPDHQVLIAESDRERVATLTVTTTPKAWPRNRLLAANSTHVRVALGLHPQVVADRADEVSLFEKHLSEARYVGEVGLDAGARFCRSIEQQERVFERILCACNEQGGKILTVHSTGAVTKVLGQLEEHLLPGRGRVILHWFTGSAAEARRAVEYGCYFSINTQMLRSSKHGAVVAKLPIDRLLTETDGPFVQVDGRAARPVDVTAAVDQLATVRSLPTAEMQRAIVENLSRLVST